MIYLQKAELKDTPKIKWTNDATGSSIVPIFQCSNSEWYWVVCKPLMCHYNKRTDGVLGDLLPDLVQGVTDFPARIKRNSVPEVFYWI